MKLGKTLLLVVAGLQALSALMLLVGSGPGTFESDTGVPMEDLINNYPTVATQYLMAQQSSLVTTLTTGLFALAILVFAFKASQNWAWYSMWILPASMIPGTISLARTENQAGVAVFGAIIILLAVLGLALSYRGIFKKSE